MAKKDGPDKAAEPAVRRNLLKGGKKKLGKLPTALLQSMVASSDAAAASPAGSAVLERVYAVVESRRGGDPAVSHSARLLSRGTAKVAQKFGEEAVECLIEAVAGNRDALIAESADVLYHLLVVWVNAGVRPEMVWAELARREGISGIAEKASRAYKLAPAAGLATTKIP